jgi:short-subunit dehydrogenase
MQTILILGATSPIGAALSEQFSKGNKIILSGRNQTRLSAIAERCTNKGAIAVRIAAADLAQTIQPIIDANSEYPIDLIVDAASSASGASLVRDTDVTSDAIRNIMQADVMSHLDIYQQLTRLNKKHPDVVFISTVLAIVKTPEREIYSAAKRLIEIYLEKIAAAGSNAKILIFRVGKVIDPKQDSHKAKAMAERVQREFSGKNITAIYGISGRILIGLSLLHPVVLNFIVSIQRGLRDK